MRHLLFFTAETPTNIPNKRLASLLFVDCRNISGMTLKGILAHYIEWSNLDSIETLCNSLVLASA